MGDVHAFVVLGLLVAVIPVLWRSHFAHLPGAVRLWLISAFLTGFCTMFGGTYGALMNLYLLALRQGKDVIGALNGAFYVGMALLALVSGPIVKLVGGVRNCATLGMAMCALGQMLFPLPSLLGATPSLAWLATTLMVASGGLTLYAVNIWPFMASRIAPEKRAYGFAGHLGLVPMGGMVGTMLSGALATRLSGSSQASTLGYAITLSASGALLIAGVIALLSIAREAPLEPAQRAATPPKRGPWPVAIIGAMVLVMIFDVSGEGVGRVFQNVYMATVLALDTQTVSMLLSYGQLVAALAVFATPSMVRKLGLSWTFVLTTLGMSVGLAVVSTVPHWLAAGGGYALLIGFSQMARAAKTQFAMEVVEDAYRPHISGFMQFAETSTVFVLASAGGHWLESGALSFARLFNLVAFSTALAALWFYLFFMRTRKQVLAVAS